MIRKCSHKTLNQFFSENQKYKRIMWVGTINKNIDINQSKY